MIYSLLLKFPFISVLFVRFPFLQKLLGFLLNGQSSRYLSIVEHCLNAIEQVIDRDNPKFEIHSKYSKIASLMKATEEAKGNRADFHALKKEISTIGTVFLYREMMKRSAK